MTVFEIAAPRAAASERGIRFADRIRAVLRAISDGLIALQEWQARAKERHQLLGLSDAALKDFGANRSDADAEGSKAMWIA
jgi:uncharacterized protein YjiS (DUF1127 family)